MQIYSLKHSIYLEVDLVKISIRDIHLATIFYTTSKSYYAYYDFVFTTYIISSTDESCLHRNTTHIET